MTASAPFHLHSERLSPLFALAAAFALPAPGLADDIGPPAASGAVQMLVLKLVVNGRDSGVLARVRHHDDMFWLSGAALRRAGLRFESGEDSVRLADLPGVRADYDAARQRLLLTVDPDWLPQQQIATPTRAYAPASSDTGLLVNYDLYATAARGRAVQASLYHEARGFGAFGTLSSSGIYGGRGQGSLYTRLDSVWRRSNAQRLTSLEAGDFISRGLPWATTVRLGGIQIYRDFSVRPDIVTYPLPEFAGTAALPSSVDLIVGGQRIAGGPVNPGPFRIENLPLFTGAGEANLVVTDMLGRSIATSLPFYVSSSLLRRGLTDFAVAAGSLRRGYGMENFAYGPMVGTASVRHGLSDIVTVEGHGELADGLHLAGGGLIVQVANAGVANAAYSHSRGGGLSGGEWTLGYAYQARGLSLGLHHSRRSRDYRDIGLLDCRVCRTARQTTSATLSAQSPWAGTLGLGYFTVREGAGRRNRLANASWSMPLVSGLRLYGMLTRDFTRRQWAGAFNLSASFGGRRVGHPSVNASLGYVNTGQGSSLRADIARALPTAGGFGWSASAIRTEQNELHLRADVSLRTDPLLLRAGGYDADGGTGWFGLSGAVVFMDNSLFAANRVADAFAVVDTGMPAIPVRYENQLVGHTGKGGRLFVPWASAYYPAKYAIDPTALPANISTPLVSQAIAVARGGGRIVRFPVRQARMGRAILLDSNGAFLPAGTVVHSAGGDDTYVGWDGLLFLEQLQDHNELIADLPDGQQCQVVFAAPADDPATIHNLGELICAPAGH